MALRKTTLAGRYGRFVDNRLIPLIKILNITPNQYTFLGLFISVVVPIGFYLHPAIGLVLIVISGFADTLDGITARHFGTESVFGAFLDSTFDRISDFFYLFGIWMLFWQRPAVAYSSALIFVGYLATFLVSYVKARATSLGVNCDTGWMERGYRTLYIIVWISLVCILPGFENTILWSGLIVYILLTSATALQRISLTRSKLSR